MERFDILIEGGTVLDGSGSSPFQADIGIVGDNITAVGNLNGAEAARTIPAKGLHISPGFIDIHTHSDISAVFYPQQSSALAMGVTTQVVGNCGLSLGFADNTPVFAFEQRWIAPHGSRIDWNSFDGFLRRLEDQGLGTNFIPLAGHGTLRKLVIGMEDRPATKEELSSMRGHLEAALQAGVWGLSSGLEYVPSGYADVAELTELCLAVKEKGGFYATHLRNEGDTLVESVEEALAVSEGAGLPLQLSHHKAEGPRNWGKVHTTLKIVEEARARGIDVQMDQYPYTAFMTGLSVQTLPVTAQSGTPAETLARLKDPVMRASIRAEMLANHPEWDDTAEKSAWSDMRIGVSRGRPEIQGRSISELAREAGRHPVDFVLDLLEETEGYVSAVNFAISEEDIALVMRYPFTSIGSDGVGTAPDGKMGEDQIHPRAYGTFPRVLGHYVRELGVLTEAEAIHKMTGLPAARMGLTDRGLIRTGYKADITIYDPDHIADAATFDHPHQYAEGIAAVIINGRIALENGRPNGTLAGTMMRKN